MATTKKDTKKKTTTPAKAVKPAAKPAAKAAPKAKDVVKAEKPAVAKVAKVSKPKIKKETKGAPLSHGVGRRKTAVARVWLRPGSGNIVVNEQAYKEYFDTDVARIDAYKPFAAIEKAASSYDVEVDVRGGGSKAQAGATRLGIARALVEINEGFRSELREHGLLTVDARRKERKKYGQRGARRKFQFVKR